MRTCLPAFLALILSAVLALPARAEPSAGPPARTFYLFGPPLGPAPPVGFVPARAMPVAVADSGTDACRQAGRVAGRAAGVPDSLMAAIARIESGRPDGTGATSPWPWSINVEGIDHVYAGKAEAIAAVRAFQARGIRSIDVGCMQVNLAYHPEAFASLEMAFDPAVNAAYAARFLTELRDRTGSWDRAVADYHSANPELGEPYRRKVMAVLPDEQRRAAALPAVAGLVPAPLFPLSPGTSSGSGLGRMLASMAPPPRMLTAAAGPLAAAPPGRDLAAYRAAPIAATSRPVEPATRRLPGPVAAPG